MAEAFMEINFKEVQRLTEEMKSTAEKIRRETDLTGMEILSATKAAWISSNADIFAGKEVKVLERIGEISDDLCRLSNDIFEKAELIYEMEQRNILLTGATGHVFI